VPGVTAGELQGVQRRDRFGVHRIGAGRIDLKVLVDQQIVFARRLYRTRAL
jgi:hypothetical protein